MKEILEWLWGKWKSTVNYLIILILGVSGYLLGTVIHHNSDPTVPIEKDPLLLWVGAGVMLLMFDRVYDRIARIARREDDG